jgi:hypothetical protein
VILMSAMGASTNAGAADPAKRQQQMFMVCSSKVRPVHTF